MGFFSQKNNSFYRNEKRRHGIIQERTATTTAVDNMKEEKK